MAEKIKRDANEMRKFARKANDYNRDVETVCAQLRKDLQVAEISVGLSDLELQASIRSLYDMERAIKKNLPLVAEAAQKLVKSADYIEEAKRILKK